MRTPDIATSMLRLAESLVLLAAPASEQIAWCERHGWCVDELGLDFDWAAGWVVPRVDEQAPGLLSGSLRDVLVRIGERLAEMSGPGGSARWDAEGLAEDSPWAEIRQMAGRALDEIVKLDVVIVIPRPS
ncbi:hypothetical protein [Actinomadura gamaensis]|uniref:Uncharacterized protein n=1 Tax=Actinomadura gamaensis TaxID=1763541 RepID=A0ABV9U6D2_9ACTN